MLRQITYKYNIYTSTVRCSVQGAQALIQEFRGGGGEGMCPLPQRARAEFFFTEGRYLMQTERPTDHGLVRNGYFN